MLDVGLSFWEDFGVFGFVVREDLFVNFWDFEWAIFGSSFDSCSEETFFLTKEMENLFLV